jgi:hypothetical protein
MSDSLSSAKELVKKAHNLLQAIRIATVEQERRLPFAADVNSFLEEASAYLEAVADDDGGAS